MFFTLNTGFNYIVLCTRENLKKSCLTREIKSILNAKPLNKSKKTQIFTFNRKTNEMTSQFERHQVTMNTDRLEKYTCNIFQLFKGSQIL